MENLLQATEGKDQPLDFRSALTRGGSEIVVSNEGGRRKGAFRRPRLFEFQLRATGCYGGHTKFLTECGHLRALYS